MTATATGSGRTLRHEVVVGSEHSIVTDEPATIGGSDSAPMPHELLPAALATCISTMVALYARRKGWTIGEIRVDVDYDPDVVPRHMTAIVHLPEGLSGEQIARLTRVAETCPVKRAFEAGFDIEEHVETAEVAA